MKLYYSSGACSLAPHIVAHELGLKMDLEPVNLKTKQYSGGDFTKVTSKGQVPTLELDNGEILTEVAVIVQYLADQKPAANLIPKAGTFERYRCQEWLNYIATELHKGIGILWKQTTPEDYKVVIKELLSKKFDYLVEQLGAKRYVMGDFNVADAYLFTVLGWTKPLKYDLTPWPSLMGYLENMRTRPGVQAAMIAEGLIKQA